MARTHYELIHEEVIREDEVILDWKHTVIAEGKTIAGLLRFAQLKKLDKDQHFIEAQYCEIVDGFPDRDTEMVGYLNELPKKK